MLPPVDGCRIVDLGFGFGCFCRWARQAGAASILGLDLSKLMLARARATTDDPGVTYRRRSRRFDLPAPASTWL